jgi:hypothetical protein
MRCAIRELSAFAVTGEKTLAYLDKISVEIFDEMSEEGLVNDVNDVLDVDALLNGV